MHLHEKVMEVLNSLARDYKSIRTMKQELAELQEELSQAHNQVHISEARVSAALDKLAYMEELVNDRLLHDRTTTESDCSSSSASTLTGVLDSVKSKKLRRTLNVSGPVQDYISHLKNFWYPVAFSADLNDDTMVGGDGIDNERPDAEYGSRRLSMNVQSSNSSNASKQVAENAEQSSRQIADFWGYVFQIFFQMNTGAVTLIDCVFWFILVPFLTIRGYNL